MIGNLCCVVTKVSVVETIQEVDKTVKTVILSNISS